MVKILVVNGPNLNMLSIREPEKYGKITLQEIETKMKEFGLKRGLKLKFFQSNSEGAIIDFLHQNYKWGKYLIINAGAYTHTSIAIRDAILSANYLTIEVHLTNIYKRENFRQKSFISDIAIGVITGFGWLSYLMALEYIYKREGK